MASCQALAVESLAVESLAVEPLALPLQLARRFEEYWELQEWMRKADGFYFFEAMEEDGWPMWSDTYSPPEWWYDSD